MVTHSKRIALRIFGLILLLSAYHLLTAYKVDFILQFRSLPSLKSIADDFLSLAFDTHFLKGIVRSVLRVYSGFAVALVTAIPIGIAIARFQYLYDLLRPVLEVFRPIPNVAWVPIAVLIFPRVEQSTCFITFVGAFFPLVLSSLRGARSVPGVLFRLGKILGFTEWQLIYKVVFPASLPVVFTGAMIAMGTSWLGVIVAESTYGSEGIGYFTFKSLQLLEFSHIIVGMLMIGMLGSVSSLLIKTVGSIATRWEVQDLS